MSKFLLFYESDPAGMQKTVELFPAHRARWAEFQRAGTLLAIGPYAERDGALAVFTTREAAQAFADSDPFVLGGVVGKWRIAEWKEALMPDGRP